MAGDLCVVVSEMEVEFHDYLYMVRHRTKDGSLSTDISPVHQLHKEWNQLIGRGPMSDMTTSLRYVGRR